MAAPPAPTEFRKTDFPSTGLGSPEALEKFFLQLNTTLKGARNALSGGLTIGDNFNAEIKTVSVTTPSSDIVQVTKFQNSWAPLASFMPPSYRICSAGDIELMGGLTGGTLNAPTGAFQVPAAYAPSAILQFGAACWNGSAGAAAGVKIDSKGNVIPAFGSNVQIFLDGVRWRVPGAAPYVMSCFPLSVQTKVSQPKGVILINCQDTAAGAVPPALGTPSWSITGTGAIQITNLPGLNFGRTYTLTLLILGG